MTCEKSPEDQALEWKGLYAQNEVGCFVGNLNRTRVAEHQFQLRCTKQLPPAARRPEHNFSASVCHDAHTIPEAARSYFGLDDERLAGL